MSYHFMRLLPYLYQCVINYSIYNTYVYVYVYIYENTRKALVSHVESNQI